MDVIRRSFFSAVGGTFTGLKNYETVFANQAFLLAGENTIRFFGTCIPLLVLLSLITAVLINGLKEMHRQLLKTAFLLPMAIPVASVVLYGELCLRTGNFKPFTVHAVPEKRGLDEYRRLLWRACDQLYLEKSWGMTLFSGWRGCLPIPESLYEAAHVDGAGTWKALPVSPCKPSPLPFYHCGTVSAKWL